MIVWVVTKSPFYDTGEWVDSIFDSEDKAIDYLSDFQVVNTDNKTLTPCAFKQEVISANGYSTFWLYEIEKYEVG